MNARAQSQDGTLHSASGGSNARGIASVNAFTTAQTAPTHKLVDHGLVLDDGEQADLHHGQRKTRSERAHVERRQAAAVAPHRQRRRRGAGSAPSASFDADRPCTCHQQCFQAGGRLAGERGERRQHVAACVGALTPLRSPRTPAGRSPASQSPPGHCPGPGPWPGRPGRPSCGADGSTRCDPRSRAPLGLRRRARPAGLNAGALAAAPLEPPAHSAGADQPRSQAGTAICPSAPTHPSMDVMRRAG